MNNVIKSVLLIILSISLTQGYSQSHSGGGDKSVGMTLGGYDITSGAMLFGVNAVFKTSVGKNLKAGANLGYFSKTILGSLNTYVVPITGLFEYHFSNDDFSPYVGADAGFYRSGISNISVTKLGIAPVFGIDYSLGGIGLNLNLKYHHIFAQGNSITSGALNFNIGVYKKF